MNKLKVIKNAQVVTENGIIWDGSILIEEKRIAKVGREIDTPIGAEVIDAKGAYVGPGFVDIHVHGGNGFNTCKQPKEAAEYFLSHGETTILATASYDWDLKELTEAIHTAKAGMEGTPNVKGLYLEGPFTNPKYGSNSENNPWRHNIEPEEFQAFVDAAGTDAKVWAIAPERPDIMPFLEYARKVNPDTIFALGHSEATPMQIRALGKYRPRIQTHSMNATGRIGGTGGIRGYGPDEYCFKEIDVYTELICDSCGIHVHPEMQQLLLHNKGIQRVLLVTDSTAHNDPAPAELAHIKDLNFQNGDLAGSKLTMELACKNIMTHTNCGIAQAFYMAATTPARAINMDDEIGSVEVGKKADLVFVDDKFNIRKVILEGKTCY